jgi:AAA domain/Primase C terminal 2 (PriCT-2)
MQLQSNIERPAGATANPDAIAERAIAERFLAHGAELKAQCSDIGYRTVFVTTFRDAYAKTKRCAEISLPELCEPILKVTARKKFRLPWLKLAKFGDTRSANKCFRYNDNVIEISGAVAEYDKELISFETACAVIKQADIRALLYTSPSHKAAKPRWRIVAPCSEHLPPEQHQYMVARLNGLFGGALTPESFTLSTSYLYGRIGNNPDHRAVVVDGDFIDTRDDLDAGALFKNNAKQPGDDKPHRPDTAEAPIGKIKRAFELLSNTGKWSRENDDGEIETRKDWAGWNEILMAGYRASGGSDEVFVSADNWCAANTQGKYDPEDVRDTWYNRFRTCPPKYIGAGTLFELVNYEHGRDWQLIWNEENPDELAAWEAEHPEQPEDDAAADNSTSQSDDTAHKNADGQPKEQPKRIIRATPFVWIDPTKIPPRQWLYRPYYIRKYPSLTISTGGVGKSSLLIVEALAMVSAKDLLGVSTDGVCLRVWYWNGEDPADELQHRFAAAIKHFELSPDDIGDRLFIDSGRQMPIVIAEQGKHGTRIATPLIERVIAALKEDKIDVLIVDPFVSCHHVSENDNSAIDQVAKSWSGIAEAANCSVMIAHHTRKPMAGGNGGSTVDDGRGATSLANAVRAARTLNNMTTDEAAKADIDEKYRRYYFRADLGKTNLTRPAEGADWFKLVSVDLENIMPGIAGDEIGVVTAWEYTADEVSVTVIDIKRAQEMITAGGPWRRNQQAKSWIGNVMAQALKRDVAIKRDKQWIEKRIQMWLSSGLLAMDRRPDPTVQNRAPVEFVIAGRAPTAADAEGI